MIGDIYKSNCGGDVQIIEQDGEKVKVRFLDTGYERDALLANVKKGKVKDHTLVYESPTVELNERYESRLTGWFTILWKKGKKCFVQFDETGYTKEVYIDNARARKVRDPYYPSVYGRGYDGEYSKKDNPDWKQARQLWCNMMKRCYSEKDTRGYYGKGVSVDNRWLCFANFLSDIKKLPNYGKWLLGHQKGQTKYNLDKDLIIEGNKVYSRDLCMFIDEHTNKSCTEKSSYTKHHRERLNLI